MTIIVAILFFLALSLIPKIIEAIQAERAWRASVELALTPPTPSQSTPEPDQKTDHLHTEPDAQRGSSDGF